MARRKKLRNTRPKALFGIGETGAIIAQTAAQVASIGAQTAASIRNAKQQAEAQKAAAKQQADALLAQNENNNELQKQMMEFTKDQNDQTRQIMRDTQMNLQMQAGEMAMHDRREASKTVLKNGGRKNKRRRKLRNAAYPLQGGNIPFRVIDGGGVIPVGQTAEGYDVYELYGNDHNHYHKTRGGHYKSGVGVKFADGQTIEGEGNQGTNQGELMITTPDDALFLSKHNVGGVFNPTQAVQGGMDPMQAYAMQEYIKQAYGISDDGESNTPPVKRNLRFTNGIAKNGTSLKRQGKATNNRHKARVGYGRRFYNWFAPDDLNGNDAYGTEWDGGSKGEVVVTAPTPSKWSKWWGNLGNKLGNTINNPKNWWVAPTISAAGNLLGAGINALGVGLGSKYLTNAINERSRILSNAYGNLKGVDMSAVFGDKASLNFNKGLYMPALRAARVYDRPQLQRVEQDRLQQANAIRNNTGSSAAMLNRLASTNATANQRRGEIYANTANAQEQIKQANNQAINEAGQANAQLMMQYLKDYTSQKADLAKFNANIENEKIIGAAEAQASGINDIGQIGSQARLGITSAFGNALAQSGLGFANALNARNTYQNNIDVALLGATPDSKVDYYASDSVDFNTAYDVANKYLDKAKAANSILDRKKYLEWANSIRIGHGMKPFTEDDLK